MCLSWSSKCQCMAPYPPPYLHASKHSLVPDIEPEIGYLKPIHIIHPFYYTGLTKCPNCNSDDVGWEAWTSTGYCEVHGLFQDELALGVQLECQTCKAKWYDKSTEKENSEVQYCTAMTNPKFWERMDHLEIPGKWSVIEASKEKILTIILLECLIFSCVLEWHKSYLIGWLRSAHHQHLGAWLRKTNVSVAFCDNELLTHKSNPEIELHLLHYHKVKREYMAYFKACRPMAGLIPLKCVKEFLSPWAMQKNQLWMFWLLTFL